MNTDGGRLIAIGLMITGIGMVAVLTAAAAERFVRSRGEADMRAHDERLAIEARAREERQAIEGRLDEIIRRLDSLARRPLG